MKKCELTCIVCPIGCHITAEIDDEGNIINLTGYTCKRGYNYAKDEITMPKRTLTTTVRAKGGHLPVVSVRTKNPIPKKVIGDVMVELANVIVKPPINIGDVVVKNILHTGVDVIATRSLYNL